MQIALMKRNKQIIDIMFALNFGRLIEALNNLWKKNDVYGNNYSA